MDSNFTQSRRLVRSRWRPDRVASLLEDAPPPMLNRERRTDGSWTSMDMLSTFHSFQDLSHAVRGCHKTVNKCARRAVDCESAVRSCRLSGCEKVLSDGSWAGHSRIVSSNPKTISLPRLHLSDLVPSLPTCSSLLTLRALNILDLTSSCASTSTPHLCSNRPIPCLWQKVFGGLRIDGQHWFHLVLQITQTTTTSLLTQTLPTLQCCCIQLCLCGAPCK